jgi:serine/threonine-protein kinase RsbW
MVAETPTTRSKVIESKPSAIAPVRESILSELEVYNFSADDVFAVHLALEEAFLNAVQHGSKMNASRQIRIDYVVDPDRVEVSVTDEGDGFDPEMVPDPRTDENLYKPQGRGLLLMRSYMDVVEFREQGNSVHMVRYKHRGNSRD